MESTKTPKDHGHCPGCKRTDGVTNNPRQGARNAGGRYRCTHCLTVWTGVRK